MNFSKPSEVIEYAGELREAASNQRMELAYRSGIDMCYAEGVQWIQSGRALANGKPGWGRDNTNVTPDSTSLRVVDNQTSFFVQKVAAGTHANSIMVDGYPASMDSGVDGAFQARVAEEAVNIEIDRSCLLAACQTANYCRAVTGQWGIALSARMRSRSVAGGEVEPDWDVRAFDFDPTDLILDPYERNRDLEKHECVVYESVWTYKKLKETFGDRIKIDENDMQTVESICPVKCELNKLSAGRIYSWMAQYSKTKAAVVQQVHVRDASGRFPTMFVMVDIPKGDKQVVNFDDPRSPFAGSGMPFQLIYGHRRTDVLWGMGDVSMMRSDQDKINLGETLFWRIIQKYAHGRYFVDKRFFGTNPNNEEIARHFTNAVGKPIVGDLSDKSRGIAYPQADIAQPPPPFLRETIERYADNMRKKSHKSEGNFGEVKTHVGNEQFSRAQDDAAEVRDVRIKEDTQAVERLIGVLYSTTVRSIKEGNPTTLAALTSKGIKQDKLAALLVQDENNPSVTIKVAEASFRNRSHRQKKIDLDNAAVNQMIDPIDYRLALARDQQAPIAAQDQTMADEAMKAARMCLVGVPWQPRPMGMYSRVFLDEFRNATFDERATANPQIMGILMQAIAQQQEVDVQAQMRADPALRAQKEQAQMQMEMQAQQAAQQAQPEQTDLGTMLAQLSGAQQPETAAA